MVHWHKMPIRISSSQSVGPCAAMADALGVEYAPVALLTILLRIFIPFTSLNFSQTQIVYRLQGTLLTLRPGEPESCTVPVWAWVSPAWTFDFHVFSSVRFVLLLLIYPALSNQLLHIYKIAIWILNMFTFASNMAARAIDSSILVRA